MNKETNDTVEVILEEGPETAGGVTHRLYLMGLGSAALVGDKVGSVVEGIFGSTMDRLVERGERFEQNSLSLIVRPAQERIESAADSGRQAGRTATSTAGTVASETRKQVGVAKESALDALSKQVEALRESVEELRKALPETEEAGSGKSKKSKK